ncbi:MAG: condensation domain-containing protein, partial [Rhodothermales bacterium]|nr:condensation domain-containing protein [Rhodothermales bacterium]
MSGPAPRSPAPAARGAPRALTKSQHLLWTGQQLHPEAPLYTMALAFTLRGPLDAEAFQRAFQALLDRSDALRTVVETRRGVPVQRVRPPAPYAVERVDLSREADPDAAFSAWAADRARRLFDLRERLFDAALVRLAPDRHGWFLNQHHLVTDAWSTAVVYRAVADLYRRALDGTLAEAPPLPPYADYVAYEQAFRASPLFKRAETHWRERLEEPVEAAPLYGKRAAAETTPTVRVTRALDAERSRRLRERARDDGALTEHIALFNRFATLLFAYLHRVSGRHRLAFGTPSHNRPTAAFKETVGVFIEVFPLQVEVADGETFASLLGKVQRETGLFLRYAQPSTSTSAVNRSVNALLNYITASFPEFAGLPMASEWVHAGHGDSRHHLRLQVHDFDAAGRFVLHFDFNAALFAPEEREAAADHFVRLLDAMLADDDRPLQAADLLAAAERERLLTRFSRAAPADYPVPETVVHAFDEQAAAAPDAVAVEYAGRTWTYREVKARADALAHTLRRHGVGREALVAVAMARSPEVIVAYLAVLKAGGAYVPLDPAHPERRLAHLLAETAPRLVLTRADPAGPLPATDATVLVVDASEPVPDAPDAGPPPDPSDLAYVLYTSGSTGRPKGV